jgi:hypothetical protein
MTLSIYKFNEKSDGKKAISQGPVINKLSRIERHIRKAQSCHSITNGSLKDGTHARTLRYIVRSR